MMEIADDELERAVTAALKADIIPIDGMDGVRIEDYLTYKPLDAVELGVNLTGKSEDGSPRWHGYSDIRGMEYEEVNRAILRPIIKAAILEFFSQQSKQEVK